MVLEGGKDSQTESAQGPGYGMASTECRTALADFAIRYVGLTRGLSDEMTGFTVGSAACRQADTRPHRCNCKPQGGQQHQQLAAAEMRNHRHKWRGIKKIRSAEHLNIAMGERREADF